MNFFKAEELGPIGLNMNDSRDRLFTQNIQQVVYVANLVYSKLPRDIPIDAKDLVLVGLHTLWDMSETFDQSLNNNFWNYARKRVVGSMWDFTRKLDEIPRSAREAFKRIREEQIELTQSLHSDVSIEEAFESLDFTEGQRQKIRSVGLGYISKINLNEIFGDGLHDSDMTYGERIPDPNCPDPSDELISDDEVNRLEEALDELEPMARSVVRLHYWNDASLDFIAKGLGVTESRVCQMLRNALVSLKRTIQKKGKPGI